MTRLMNSLTKFNILFLVSILALFNTYAQEEAVETVQEETLVKKKFEKVQVTGSRIKRTDFEGPTPVKIINRQDIENSPYNSVGDYFRDLTVSAFGAKRETSGVATAGSSNINIRGIGSTNTLVLLNNVRLQPNGISGAVDLNLIPQIAIESSSILKSGASAIYGSDALGGVINLHTRRDFTGAEASMQLVVPEEEGGERIDFSVIGGKQFKDGSITAAFQYRNNKFIMSKDREWSKAASDGNIGFSKIGPIPTYTNIDGNSRLRIADVAACKADPSQYFYVKDDGDGNEFCRYAYANKASNIPEIQQYSTYLNYNKKFNSRTNLDIVTMFSQQNTQWIYAPTPGGDLSVAKSAVQGWGAFTQEELNTMPDPVSFAYRIVPGGNRVNDLKSNAYNAMAKLEREFRETWVFNASVGYGVTYTKDSSPTGYFKKDALNAVFSSGKFNPYNPNHSIAELGDAPFAPYQKTKSVTYSTDLNVSGELMELPWNRLPISMALGTQYNHFYYATEADPETTAKNIVGGAGINGGGNRDIGSVYLEVVAPLMKQLELQVAARFDWFSDYGTAFSPQAAIKYSILDNLIIRSSVAKGYKAPLMQELYAKGSSGFPFFIDQKACENTGRSESNRNCSPQQWFTVYEAPENLKAEEAITYNLGAVYEPIRGLSFVVDGWYADISNVIGADLELITQAELAGKKALLSERGIIIERDEKGFIRSGGKGLTVPTQNLSTRKQAGVDLEVAYAFSTKIGNFRVSDEHSQAFKYIQGLFKGLPTVDYLDDYGFPKWRNNISISYMPVRGHMIKLDHSIIAGQKTANRYNRVKTYVEHNVTYFFKIRKKGEFKIGIKNIFGNTPPYDKHTGLNSSIYNDWGRYAFVNYRHSF